MLICSCVGTVLRLDATTTYTYGSDGLRRKMQVGTGVLVSYAIDGQSVVMELKDNNRNGTNVDGSGNLETGEASARYLVAGRGVEYRYDYSSQQTKWYLYDGLGSVVAEVSTNASDPLLIDIHNTTRYDAYGAARVTTGTGSTSSKFVGKLGHTTDDTGLIYMRARYYDPSVGRFISEDPSRDSTNWFAYCDNNPVNLNDNTGLSATPSQWFYAAIAGIFWIMAATFGALALIMAPAVLAADTLGAIAMFGNPGLGLAMSLGPSGALAAVGVAAVACTVLAVVFTLLAMCDNIGSINELFERRDDTYE